MTKKPGESDRRVFLLTYSVCLRENFDDGLVDGVLWDEANDLLGYLAAFEEQEGGDAANAVAHGGRGVRVDVHLHDLELALIVARDFIDNWRHRCTRTAPSCPKIYQDRLIQLLGII